MVWYRLLRAAKQGVDFISPCFEQAGLSAAQFDLLAAIAMDEGRTQQTYAKRLTVTKGNLTQLIDRLEKRGLMLRIRDGRTKRLHLTDEGWETIGRILPEHNVLMHELFSKLTEDDVAHLSRILRKLKV